MSYITPENGYPRLTNTGSVLLPGQSVTFRLETPVGSWNQPGGESIGTLVPYTIEGVTSADINGAPLTGNIALISTRFGQLNIMASSQQLTQKTMTLSLTDNPDVTSSVTIFQTDSDTNGSGGSDSGTSDTGGGSTIIVTQSAAANFPNIPAVDPEDPTSATILPGVYEAWPLGTPWTVNLGFAATYIDPLTEQPVNATVTDITVVSNPDNLFEFAEVNFTKLSGNSMRVYGPALNAFRDAYYMFQLEYAPATFTTSNGVTVENTPVVLPNQNDPNVVINDEDFVMPPRPLGAVQIIDTGEYGGVITASLPRYFQRKLKPNTTLPWISFVTYQAPSAQQITKTFTVSCKYTVPGTGEVTESVTLSQTIYFSYEAVMQYISSISEQRRIE